MYTVTVNIKVYDYDYNFLGYNEINQDFDDEDEAYDYAENFRHGDGWLDDDDDHNHYVIESIDVDEVDEENC